MKIVMIGGGGDVGQLVGPSLATFAEVVVAEPGDAHPIEWGRIVRADVLDPSSLREALAGADAVVYLAMGTKSGWGSARWARQQFDINVTGLHTTLEVAGELGVSHVVIAGSMSVFGSFPGLDLHDEPDATDAYGLSKRLGEKVAEAMSRRHGYAVTVIRLTFPRSDDDWRASDDPNAFLFTSGTDTAAAFEAVLRRRPPAYAVFQISGDPTRKIVDWGPAEEHLGWRPTMTRPYPQDGTGL